MASANSKLDVASKERIKIKVACGEKVTETETNKSDSVPRDYDKASGNYSSSSDSDSRNSKSGNSHSESSNFNSSNSNSESSNSNSSNSESSNPNSSNSESSNPKSKETEPKHSSKNTGNTQARPKDRLSDLLAAETGPLTHERSIKILIQACHHVSARTSPHGKLSPDLIQISLEAKNETVLIHEAGSAKSKNTQYYAPESEPGSIDASADVYSLGVILYEMISNKNSSAAQQNPVPKDLANWLAYSPSWSSTPSKLKTIIRKCLQQDPVLRYTNAEDLRFALEDFLYPPKAVLINHNYLGKTLAALVIIMAGLCCYLYLNKPATIPEDQLAIAPPAASPPTLTPAAPLSSTELGILGKYEVVVLLDKSGSMLSSIDGPGRPIESANSKWKWISDQLATFSQQTQSCFPSGFSVLAFDSTVERFDNCHEKELLDIYNNQTPGGGTNMAAAFEEAIKNRSALNKPMAVLVITDGIPDDPDALTRDIAQATQADSKFPIKVVFMTIGNQGHPYVTMMDTLLTGEAGAKYDAVEEVEFDKLRTIGLGHALAQSVEAEKSETP